MTLIPPARLGNGVTNVIRNFVVLCMTLVFLNLNQTTGAHEHSLMPAFRHTCHWNSSQRLTPMAETANSMTSSFPCQIFIRREMIM